MVFQVILDWDKKASKKYVSKEMSKEIHAKAEPFLKWLQQAEEESSGEEEEEDVEVSQAPSFFTKVEVKKNTNIKKYFFF